MAPIVAVHGIVAGVGWLTAPPGRYMAVIWGKLNSSSTVRYGLALVEDFNLECDIEYSIRSTEYR